MDFFKQLCKQAQNEESTIMLIEQSYTYWKSALFEKCVRMFTWNGLPNNIPQREIEMRLISEGYCGFVNDKKVGYMVNTSMAKAPFAVAPYEKEKFKGKAFATVRLLINAFNGSNHTKGVGVIHSVHGNMLIGPNAVETPDREDTATYRDEVDAIIRMQQHLAPGLEFRDIIAYFTGVRAPTYEEDFVVRKSSS